MTFTTHMIMGALAAKPFMAHHPVLGFLTAVASHYLVDAIPHWDYHLYSVDSDKKYTEIKVEYNLKNIFTDIWHVALDSLVGLTILLIIFRPSISINSLSLLFLAALGGILPDLMLAGSWLYKKFPLAQLTQFHNGMHTKKRFGNKPLMGIIFQIAIDLAAIFFILKV